MNIRRSLTGIGRVSRLWVVSRRWGTVGEGGHEGIVHDIDSTDPFQILGVSRYSTTEEVTGNFKKLAMVYHPDRPNGSEEKFGKLREAKDWVLQRLGEKDKDGAQEEDISSNRHEPEFTYDEETTQWEFKKGRMRMYDDYVDVGVERQRVTIWMVQAGIAICTAWVLIENFIEVWFANAVTEDSMAVEGRMFASSKRYDYEKEAETIYIRKRLKGIETNSTYIESFEADDLFSPQNTHKVRRHISWTSYFISIIETIMPTFGRWLRFLWLPDTITTVSYG
eukprot:TRINITY_DN9673_c0_g1_i2.p1 TRINITY_DN9673_c0_g1~~TRINITY_DN9673_c0_g1_i2.p1  ORF type:complete len:280 (+),score=56.42 TRINITY_DN9673_c0_g1_i2:3-842(+)